MLRQRRMERYRKILVPFDGSSSALHALEVAIQLAQADKAWLKALSVVPPYEGDLELIGVSNIKETLEGPSKKHLADAKMVADKHGQPILLNIEQGEPYERIVQVAEEELCDVIVMGRRGLGRIERELVGSVTARVIGYTHKDVLVVPAGARVGWSKILLATDGSAYSKEAEERAVDLAAQHGAELFIVGVVDTNDEFFASAPQLADELVSNTSNYLKNILAVAQAAGIKASTIIKEGEPNEMIADAANEVQADIILMGSHGRKGITRLLMGSVTERVIGRADCPVLVVHLK